MAEFIPAGGAYTPPGQPEGLSPLRRYLLYLQQRGVAAPTGYDMTQVGAAPNVEAMTPPADTELARLQNRAAVMSQPSLRDTYGSPGDVGLGVPPVEGPGTQAGGQGQSLPLPAPGTGYITNNQTGKTTFLGGNQYDQGAGQPSDQLPGGLPAWAYPLKTTRYRRSGQPDLEVVQAQVPGNSLQDIAILDKTASAFKDPESQSRWFEQTYGRKPPAGYEAQAFRTERRAEEAAKAIGTERELSLARRNEELAAKRQKVREEGIAIDKSFDTAMAGLNERMTAANNLLTNRFGLWQITGAIGGQDIPEVLRTDSARRALADYEQVQAQTFVQALENLKNASKSGATGLGQLTEVEGKKIQTAIAALKRTLSYEDFAAKLQAYEKQLQASQEKLLLGYQAHRYGFPSIRAYEAARQAEIARRTAERGAQGGTQGGGASGAY